MEHFTVINGAAAFFGTLLMFLEKYRKRDVKRDFNLKYWFKNNTVDLFYSVAASVGLFLAVKDVSILVGKWLLIDPPYILTAFLCGLLGKKIISKILKMLK
jgi:hypothetical protein